MSWQDYVDTNLVGSGHCHYAAIIGVDGGGVWAKSEGWAIEADCPAIVEAMTKSPDDLFAAGLKLGTKKFFTIQAENNSFYGKCGTDGLAMACSKQAIVIGYHGEGPTGPNCKIVVEQIRDYLLGVGY
uniref:Profilin n=1 Tax=Eutreptiella gymnastica TaxID=73025 RepID=A0A7S1N2L6_9EUGL|mmetsp:Transcript_111286/g.193100  ORF Transcript_111286/g.193100 Transcript_111286/m.193100 type:complete len:128 (+) Transcript_111286:27-410(+)